MNEMHLKMLDIFIPQTKDGRDAVLNSKAEVAHYTTADVAMSIIDEKKLWMRNARCMNDYMEVKHGWQMLENAFSDNSSSSLRKSMSAIMDALNEFDPTLKLKIPGILYDNREQILNNTFTTSFTLHTKNEIQNGRLSMWREYSQGSVGVALVFNNDVFFQSGENIGVYGGIVSYLSEYSFGEKLKYILKKIEENENIIFGKIRDNKDYLEHYFKYMLLDIAFFCKNPGFIEEKECRMIHNKFLYPNSFKLGDDVRTIRGVPQTIKTIPLEPFDKSGVNGAEVGKVLKRLIIGPTQYPDIVRDALIKKLEKNNIGHSEIEIMTSDIPLRTQH